MEDHAGGTTNTTLFGSAWANSSSPVTFGGPEGRFDFAVRNGAHVTSVFLQVAETDSVGRPIIVEINIPPPVQLVVANAAYVLWSINSMQSFLQYTFGFGAVVDGVQSSVDNLLSPLADFAISETVSVGRMDSGHGDFPAFCSGRFVVGRYQIESGSGDPSCETDSTCIVASPSGRSDEA
ncbi:hypothetical protein K438DRAFT_1981665 [Mycena galopus ATCC 62051]|nr:hypothetical protein K438DRAFT_1981665 [Mycena galopus ATCC 62051]